jgi:hypothetical protein
MSIASIDSTLLKILFPTILLLILILIIINSKSISSNGNIIFIDYFNIRTLDISFALIILYIMAVFLVVSILFSYNQLYIKNNTCSPIMEYLGSKKACIRTKYENFENINSSNETMMDKFTFIGNMIKIPFIQIYSWHLAIIAFILKSLTASYLQIMQFIETWSMNQDAILYKIKCILIDPILIKLSDPINKSIRHILSYKYVYNENLV